MKFWMRFGEGRDADMLSLPLLVEAAAPVVMEVGATGSSTLEMTVLAPIPRPDGSPAEWQSAI